MTVLDCARNCAKPVYEFIAHKMNHVKREILLVEYQSPTIKASV